MFLDTRYFEGSVWAMRAGSGSRGAIAPISRAASRSGFMVAPPRRRRRTFDKIRLAWAPRFYLIRGRGCKQTGLVASWRNVMPKRSIPFAAPAALSLALGAPAVMQVVSEWPRLPAGWKLGQGSGVTVGGDGRVYALHRGERPFLLLDRNGKVARHWGDGLFTWPHGIRVAPNGNVWITDGGTGWWPTPNPIPGRGHVVLEFSAAGKLLRTFGRQGESGEDAEHFNGPADVAFSATGDF